MSANPNLPTVADVVRDDAWHALSLPPVDRAVFLAERAAVLDGLIAFLEGDRERQA